MGSQKNENSSATITTETKLTPVYGKIILSLENCLLPVEKLEKSPSVIDGLDPETEYDLRIIGCELIQTAGILLKLPQVAMATGQILFQRFYYCTSFVKHPMDVTAMGCIYLASKIEEAPRRVRDVINVFHHIRQVSCQKPITPLILDESYVNLKKEVIRAERRILKELGFCVHVKHPHKLIVMYLQVLTLQDNKHLMQLAWNYMNDSLRTEAFLRYSPETVACACIYLSARILKIALPKNPSWFSIFNVKEEDIIDVCKRIINLYHRAKVSLSVVEALLLNRQMVENRQVPADKKYANSTVSKKHTSPVSKKHTSPINKKYTSPVNKKYTSPVNKKYTSPVNKKYTSPVNKKYASPVNKKYTSPVNKKYTSPINKKYTSPVNKKYTSPVSKKYTGPASKKYASPISKKYSRPVSKKYTSPVRKKYAMF